MVISDPSSTTLPLQRTCSRYVLSPPYLLSMSISIANSTSRVRTLAEIQVGAILQGEVLPDAVDYFAGRGENMEPDFDSDEDEDDGEGSIDLEDEEDQPSKKKPKKA
jgi:hypothetical protein